MTVIDRPKRDYEQDGTVFDHDGLVDVESTKFDREFGQRWDGKYIEPNSPPKKLGKVDAKTICRRAVSELTECGSSMCVRVLLFYIDCANRNTGNSWLGEEKIARALRLKNSKTVSRANRYWCKLGFLKIPRKGRVRPDGTCESNLYQVQWLPPDRPLRQASLG